MFAAEEQLAVVHRVKLLSKFCCQILVQSVATDNSLNSLFTHPAPFNTVLALG
jgi:hypothetical protein